MICSISGEVPKAAVVSLKSGHVFERSLIEKYIGEHHKCPITGDSLTLDDLLHIKCSSVPKPRPPQATSVPALLKLFQDEWDATMLETFQVKKQYQEALQELSHALYQNDAACRVIARLIKERDEAREALLSLNKQISSNASNASASNANAQKGSAAAAAAEELAEMDVDVTAGEQEQQLSAEMLQQLTECSQTLSKDRKQRKHQLDEAQLSKVSSMALSETVSDLLENASLISCSTLANGTTEEGGGRQLVAMAADKVIELYDISVGAASGQNGTTGTPSKGKKGKQQQQQQQQQQKSQQLAVLKTHTKTVNAIAWTDDSSASVLLSASSDKTVRGWTDKKSNGKWSSEFILKHHADEVVDVCPHPLSSSASSESSSATFYLSFSADGEWSFNEGAKSLASVRDQDGAQFTCGTVHPDGLLLATGDRNGRVKIWELSSQSVVFECPELHAGPVKSLAFSDNGYYFATSGEGESIVKIWDLRKLAKVKEISVSDDDDDSQSVSKVKFDVAGTLMGVAVGGEIKLYIPKQWTEVHSLSILAADFTFSNSDLLLATSDQLQIFRLPSE